MHELNLQPVLLGPDFQLGGACDATVGLRSCYQSAAQYLADVFTAR